MDTTDVVLKSLAKLGQLLLVITNVKNDLEEAKNKSNNPENIEVYEHLITIHQHYLDIIYEN